MKRRNVLTSPRLSELKKRRKRAVLNKFLICLFGLIAVFVFLAYVSGLKSLNIAEVEVVGNKVVDTETVKSLVSEEISGKYLWLFPKSNILYYPKGSIERKLGDKFKVIMDTNLSVKNNKILEVSFTERVPKYTWCGAALPNGEKEKCYFLDENGYVFDEAPYFSGTVYFKFYGDGDMSPGDYFSKSNFKQLITFKNALISIGLKPNASYLGGDGDAQMFLSGGASTTAGPKIIFKADADLQNVAENLETALATEPLKSKFKNKYSSLEYIDLRFGNKVYDKFQ